MKRIIALLTLLALVLTFAACGKGGSADGETAEGAANGEILPALTLDGKDNVSIACDITVDSLSMSQTYYHQILGDMERTLMLSAEGVEQYFVKKDGEVKGYVRMPGQTEFTSIEQEAGSGDLLSLFGYEWQDNYDDLTVEKTGEEKVGGYDCAVYDMKYASESGPTEGRIWVDGESGVWVRHSYTLEGSEYTFTVTDIGEEKVNMPGTVPVSVTPGQIYSQDGLTLNLKGIEFDPAYAATLKLEAVNSTDSDLKVKSRFFDVNGLCIGGSVFSVAVPAGESAEFDVNISDKACDIAGIDMIEEMEFSVSAEKYHTEQDGEGSHDVSDGMLIEYSVPVKITAECPVEPEAEESGERRLLCKADDFTAYFGGIRENSSGGYDFIVYYESEFSEDIRLTVNIHEVNGKAYDDFEKVYLYSMRKGFGGFSLWSDKVTEEPTELKLSFEAYYGELYNGTCILEQTEPFVLTVG